MADVTYEVRGQAAWVTFDRPEAHNAMTFAMYDRLVEHCEAVDADDDVQRDGPARRRRQGLRRRHRHPPVRRLQVRPGRARLRGPDRRGAGPPGGRAQADDRAGGRLRHGLRPGHLRRLRPARDHRRRQVRHADRPHRRQLPLDGQLRPPGRRPRRRAAEGGDLPRAADQGRRRRARSASPSSPRTPRRTSRNWSRRSPTTPRRRCG